jgi:hypothetical protein
MVEEARMTYEHETITPGIFTRMTLGPGEKSIFVPKFGTATARDLTDGVDMTESQQLTITGTTHVTDEAGCKVIITKKLRNQMKDDVYRRAGQVIGNAMKKKIDEDGLGLFSGLSTGLGGAGTTFTLDYLLAAITQMHGKAEPAPDPIFAVLHPYQYHEIKDLLSTPGTNNVSDAVFDKQLLGKWRGNEKLWGVPIFVDGNISVDTSDDAYGAVLSRIAFIYLVGWEPETWIEYDGSLRGWEIGIVADYGMVEEDDGHGRYMLFDASAPTS